MGGSIFIFIKYLYVGYDVEFFRLFYFFLQIEVYSFIFFLQVGDFQSVQYCFLGSVRKCVKVVIVIVGFCQDFVGRRRDVRYFVVYFGIVLYDIKLFCIQYYIYMFIGYLCW